MAVMLLCLQLPGSKVVVYIFFFLQAAVETQRKYKHVLWYSLFVAAYLIVLYLQASAYNSGEVVSTLRHALMPGQPSFRTGKTWSAHEQSSANNA